MDKSFIKNIGIVASGAGLIQLLPIFTAPLTYRLYGESDYGLLGVYTAFASILGTSMSFKLDQSLVLEKRQTDARKLLLINFYIVLLRSVLTLLLLFGLHDIVIGVFNLEGLGLFYYLVPLSCFNGGLKSIFNNWADRRKDFAFITKVNMLTAIVTPIFSIIFYFMKTPNGLIISLVVTGTANAILLMTKYGKYFVVFGKEELSLLLSRYKSFYVFGFASDVFNTLSRDGIVILINKWLGTDDVAYFNLARRILGIPATMIGRSIGKVFYVDAIKDYHKYGSYRANFLKVRNLTLVLGVVYAVAAYSCSPFMFEFVFGADWVTAGVVAQALVPFFSIRFVTGPLANTMLIHQKNSLLFFKEVIVFFSTVVGFYFGAVYFDALYLRILMFSVSYFLPTLVFYLYLNYLSKQFKC